MVGLWLFNLAWGGTIGVAATSTVIIITHFFLVYHIGNLTITGLCTTWYFLTTSLQSQSGLGTYFGLTLYLIIPVQTQHSLTLTYSLLISQERLC